MQPCRQRIDCHNWFQSHSKAETDADDFPNYDLYLDMYDSYKSKSMFPKG